MNDGLLWRIRRLASYWMIPEGVRVAARHARDRRELANPRDPQARLARKLASSNVALRDSRKGKRCFILATGPSVAKQDLRGLRNELCIGVGFFFLHADARLIDPEFHVAAPNHDPFDFDMIERDLKGATANYTDRTRVLYGHSPYTYSIMDYLESHPDSASKKPGILDYTAAPILGDDNVADESIWDIAGRPFRPRTVIYCAIQLAAYLGCSEIVLVGCDHDYLSDVSRTENHFYRESDGNPNDAAHLARFTTERWFEEYYFRWRDYRLMQTHLATRGVRIINATEGGMLDVFPRARLADLLQRT